MGTLCKDGMYYQAKADLLNKQFSSVFTRDSASPYQDNSVIEFNTFGIVKLLSEFRPFKSPGSDCIPA